MAFNVSDYVKAARKPFTKRITDPVVSTAARGHSAGASSIAQTTADSLLQTAGASVGNIKETSNITTDSICFVPSGLLDHDKNVVIGQLHKAIKPVNQLKMRPVT